MVSPSVELRRVTSSSPISVSGRRRGRRPLTARLATERARRLNPRLTIAARGRGRIEIAELRRLGAGRVSDPDAEAAFELARHALQRMGVSGPELIGIVTGLRKDAYGR